MSENYSRLEPPVGPQDQAQGSSDAAVTLVEYGDYQCPYCGEAYPIVKRVQKRLGSRLRFVFRNFPLAEMHPFATAAAEMAEAAALLGKFWQMHDMLYEHQEALDSHHLTEYAKRLHLDTAELKQALGNAAVTERVRSDIASGVRSGVNGTPTFFINGTRFDGNWTDEDELAAALEAESSVD
jgi:protein-disulfide isomerase